MPIHAHGHGASCADLRAPTPGFVHLVHIRTGFLLSFVYDAARDESDLVVLDAADLDGEPLATVALGQHLPPLFHGIWVDEIYD